MARRQGVFAGRELPSDDRVRIAREEVGPHRPLDRLAGLHGDLSGDDGLHKSLHAVTFVWQYFEQELHIVAHGKN